MLRISDRLILLQKEQGNVLEIKDIHSYLICIYCEYVLIDSMFKIYLSTEVSEACQGKISVSFSSGNPQLRPP